MTSFLSRRGGGLSRDDAGDFWMTSCICERPLISNVNVFYHIIFVNIFYSIFLNHLFNPKLILT